MIDPYTFSPKNEAEFALKEAWRRIEPSKPESFAFYVFAYKRGFPAQMFFQFASEIEQDPQIKNKGAVFVTKVLDFLKYHDLLRAKMIDNEAKK